MRRRKLIAFLGASAALPLAATVQQRKWTYSLGCLLPLPREAPENIAFFEELRRRGLVEGQNLRVVYRAYGLYVDLISNMRPSWSKHA